MSLRMDDKLNQFTIQLAVLEILDATGISQLPEEEKDKFAEDIEKQLSAAVAVELMNHLDQAGKEAFTEALKAGNAVSAMRALLDNVQDAEEKAMRAVDASKKNFIAQYFSKLQEAP